VTFDPAPPELFRGRADIDSLLDAVDRAHEVVFNRSIVEYEDFFELDQDIEIDGGSRYSYDEEEVVA